MQNLKMSPDELIAYIKQCADQLYLYTKKLTADEERFNALYLSICKKRIKAKWCWFLLDAPRDSSYGIQFGTVYEKFGKRRYNRYRQPRQEIRECCESLRDLLNQCDLVNAIYNDRKYTSERVVELSESDIKNLAKAVVLVKRYLKIV